MTRVAIFTHDTFGLGHVRRALHITRALAAERPDVAILLVTGSPALHAMEGLPRNADYVKIPTIVKTGDAELCPPHLPCPLSEVSALRERLIREAVLGFDPDVFLVDNFPLGSGRELLLLLDALRSTHTRVALGLRDIVDAPDVVRADWARRGIYEVLDRDYDRIFVYGMRDVLDVSEAYALPEPVARRVRYCGYVTGPTCDARDDHGVLEALGLEAPFLLATGGGGGDAYPLLEAFVEAVPLLTPMAAAVITGPLMSGTLRERLRIRAGGRPGVVVHDHVSDLRPLIAAAEAVVCMGGYNTAAEVVSLGARAVIVPRTWRYGEHAHRATASVEWEQTLRARALAGLGLADVLEPDELSPHRLAAAITAILERPRPTGRLELSGAASVRDELLDLAEGVPGGARVAG
jgi:predicted glycosyltransferase